MVKILSQAGRSLADMYDVVGSIAGIEELETRELGIVHELGATVFSERFRTTFRLLQSGAVAQDTDIDLAITNMPQGISRILGVQILSDVGSRILNCAVSLNDPFSSGGTDFPIWAADIGNTRSVRVEIAGTVSTFDMLMPEVFQTLPSFVTVGQHAADFSDIHVRAQTTGFGAGDVLINAIIYFAFTFTGGVSAFGARVPSW